ncbi:hypothetical protein E1301_Tti001756 [Triplophysa tibetana]|uniref:Uncharacterized protein n=1 Tax=Triplophysa tibetana TaxID=1572043 RepID=A0A5A9P565_9TELE|nr:hypothetical protein E1301_Tti001756 [Triplophysa tibetana]
MDAVYPGKIKKKKRERELQGFVKSSNVQNNCEKKVHKKNKRGKDVEILSDQTPTEKKKKRKLNKREFDIDNEQATLIDDGLLHEVNDATSPSKEVERKKKRKKVKRKHSDCDDTAKDPHEEQSGVTTEMENMPNEDDRQTAQDLTDPVTQTHIQTFQIKKKNGQHRTVGIDLKLWDELEEFIPDIKSHNLANVRIMILYDLPRFKEFKKQDIVDYLLEEVKPKLENECKDLDENDLPADQKQSFLLSDIFQDVNENCDADSDEGNDNDANNDS